MTTESASEIINDFAEEIPGAYRLALAASLAVRVEPELVRALRLALFPELDAGAEADLWFSPLVRSQTPLALEFEPEVLRLLRRNLAQDQEFLEQVWEVLKDFHGDAPVALRWEEELTWLGLSRERNEALIETRLHSVLAAVRGGQRAGLARWASRALPLLPEKARETEAARRLSFVAGVQTGAGPVLDAMPSTGMTEEWLSEGTTRELPRVKVGVRLLKNETPDPEPHALPMLVEFSYPPAPKAEVIDVPDTYRLLLEISWQEGKSSRRLRQLSLLPDETRRVETGYREVGIRTALGDIFTLSPRFDYDFLLIYDIAVELWAKNLIERLEQYDWHGRRLRVAATPVGESPSYTFGLDEELESTFGLSRKVGYAISASSASFAPEQLEPLRPEPRGRRDWLIPLKVGSIGQNFAGAGPLIDFSREDRSENGLRALWKAITGEDLPLPEIIPEPVADGSDGPVRVFISYSHKDKTLRDELVRHLAPLEEAGLLASGSRQPFREDRYAGSRDEWQSAINRSLDTAQIILILVSPAYLASDYDLGVEMQRAMELHESGSARLVPVILRPCLWQDTPLGKIQALPFGARPVAQWRRRSEAFANIAEGVRLLAEELRRQTEHGKRPDSIPRTPVVGFVPRRDTEGKDIVARLKEELAPQGNRLVTLWGAGGVGKTTLAAEAARALRGMFEGRIVWSNAEHRAGFTLSTLLDHISMHLDRQDLLSPPLNAKMEEVLAVVADRPVLIVLANYDTIAPDAQQTIEQWFARARCSALFTSRHRINSTHNIVVQPMSPAEAKDYLERLIAQVQDTEIFSSEVRQRIYESAEGNPLVLQWVVAQIDNAQDPRTVLEELAQGEGDAAARVFDRSFDLPQLGDDGRAALLALSLFEPSASRPALAEVAGFGKDERRLNEAIKNLAALSLIKGLEGNARFTIEGLVHSLARARLSRDKRDEVFRRRFVAHFLRYTEAHAKPTAENFAALEAEKDNVVRAVDVAFGIADWPGVLRLASVLSAPGNGMLSVHGYWDTVVRLGQQGLQAARLSKNEAAIAGFAVNVAVMFSNRGELAEARRLYDESLRIQKRLGDQRGIAVTLHELGRLALWQGELEEARSLYDESLRIQKRLGDQRGIAVTLQQLATLAQEQRELEEARRLYNESLEIQKRLGDQSGIGANLNQLGWLSQTTGELKEARRLYDESLEIQKRLGNQSGIANTLHRLATLMIEEGELTEARRLFDESLTIYRRLGSQQGIAGVLYNLGRLAAQGGDMVEATRLMRESLSIFEKIRSPSAQMVRDALANMESPPLQ